MFYGVLFWTIHELLGLYVCSSKFFFLHIYTHNLFVVQSKKYITMFVIINTIYLLN